MGGLMESFYSAKKKVRLYEMPTLSYLPSATS